LEAAEAAADTAEADESLLDEAASIVAVASLLRTEEAAGDAYETADT
jgi:hypothetical protein